MKNKKGSIVLTLVIIIIWIITAGGGGWFLAFLESKKQTATPLPPAHTYDEAVKIPTQNEKKASDKSIKLDEKASPKKEIVLPEETNLSIPFVLQAPNQNWVYPYEDFCEEASVLMAASYLKNSPILNSNDADAKLLSIMDFEMKKFGYHKDTNIEETATILRELYNLQKIEIVYNPSVNEIKIALAEGKAVVVPLAGRELKNPNFRSPGPLYHMLVIKGYDKNDNFITNEPGTRKGANYRYKTGIIMNAIHDWNNGDVYNGKKAVIIAG
ncbi:MAG TPA: C39 family peptidase [Candidatus Moranbacteria bacterium]|nr:C39 family peptidase [Candidatus Moranbacteria bacterium]HRZ33457.1 C39 family peptidase [Candidatus Moranbacteria bacterium]